MIEAIAYARPLSRIRRTASGASAAAAIASALRSAACEPMASVVTADALAAKMNSKARAPT
jgi:hypothetical protein